MEKKFVESTEKEIYKVELMKDNNDIIWELIAQKMAGVLDPKSEVLLQELLQDTENRAIYEALCATRVEIPSVSEQELSSTQNDTMRKIMCAIPSKAQRINIFLKFAVAASIIICVGILTYQFFISQSQEQWIDYYCQAGGFTKIQLSDNSHVYINSDSRLRYPIRFSGRQRSVEMEGEVFFEVTRDPKKPFIVHSDMIEVRVIGTSFNIKSYKSDSLIYATLVDGCIELIVNGHTEHYILEPNEQACISKISGDVTISNIDPDFNTGWKNGHLTFYKMKFTDICTLLQRKYGYTIEIRDQDLSNTIFTGRFIKDENIFQVLDIIRQNTPFSYSVQDNVIIITTTK